LHKLVRAGPTELEFRTPQGEFVRQGFVVWLLTWLLSGPIVSGAMLIAMALGMPEPTGDSELFAFGALGVLVCIGFGWGLVVIATQRHRAEKTAVRFDANRRLVQFPERSVAWHEIDALVAAVRGQGSRSQRLELVLRNTGERLPVVLTRSSIMPQEFGVLTERLADLMRVAPHITWQNQNVTSRGRYTFGLSASEKLLVLLTLFVPLGALFTAITQRRGSLVRFVAVQELVRAVATFVIVLLSAGFSVLLKPAPTAVPSSPLLREPALLVLLCLLGFFMVWSQLAALVAVVRAFDGEAWIVPGLGPVVRRFLPDARTVSEARAGYRSAAPPAMSIGLERGAAPWPKTTISQAAVTSLIAIGVTFLTLLVCGMGTVSWFSLPNYPVPASKFRANQLREIERLVETEPGEHLIYVGVSGFFDLAAGLSVVTNRRVRTYDPNASPRAQSIELSRIDNVDLKASGGWSEPSHLIVSGAGQTLDLPLWDTENGDRKFVDALEKARTQANQRR
jgi:hypothetical protein